MSARSHTRKARARKRRLRAHERSKSKRKVTTGDDVPMGWGWDQRPPRPKDREVLAAQVRREPHLQDGGRE